MNPDIPGSLVIVAAVFCVAFALPWLPELLRLAGIAARVASVLLFALARAMETAKESAGRSFRVYFGGAR